MRTQILIIVISLILVNSDVSQDIATKLPDDTYVISLQRDAGRRSAIVQRLTSDNAGFRMFDAIDAATLTDTDFASYHMAGWFDERGCDDLRNSSARTSRFACSFSHLHVLYDVYQRNLGSALILEDDVWLEHDFWEYLPRYFAQVPADFDIVYPGFLHAKKCEVGLSVVPRGVLILQPRYAYCLHAYIVSRSFLVRLFETNLLLPIRIDFDMSVAEASVQAPLRIFAFGDQIAGQRSDQQLPSLINDQQTAASTYNHCPTSERISLQREQLLIDGFDPHRYLQDISNTRFHDFPRSVDVSTPRESSDSVSMNQPIVDLPSSQQQHRCSESALNAANLFRVAHGYAKGGLSQIDLAREAFIASGQLFEQCNDFPSAAFVFRDMMRTVGARDAAVLRAASIAVFNDGDRAQAEQFLLQSVSSEVVSVQHSDVERSAWLAGEMSLRALRECLLACLADDATDCASNVALYCTAP